ncbi:MAG: hypothetical protein ACMXYE_02430 [Candidatus Woesearchaeota archaeon]
MDISLLEKKEQRIIATLRGFALSHKHVSLFVRLLKGLLLGFAFGNVIVAVTHTLTLQGVLLYLFAVFVASYFFIHYERRVFHRKGHYASFRRFSIFILIALSIASLTLVYTSFLGFMVIVITMLLFTSIAYGLE